MKISILSSKFIVEIMRREESSNFFGFIFSLLIFLFIRDVQARKIQQTLCSSSCGDIKNISYPFRLKADPARCGHPDYELSCQSNKTILEFNFGKLYVKRISYEDQRITVVDVNLADGNCSLPHGSLSLFGRLSFDDSRYGMHYPNFTDANFVRCSSRKINYPTYRRLPCLKENQSYVYVNYGGYLISDLPKSCSFISTVPIHKASVQYPSYEAINKLLQSGFDLIWFYECWHCELGGGRCLTAYYSGRYHNRCQDTSLVNLLIWILPLLVSFLFRIISSLLEFLWLLLSWWYYQFVPNLPLFVYFLYEISLFKLVVILFVRFIIVMVFVGFIIHKYKVTKKIVDKVEKFLYNQQSWMPKRYSYMEIIAITNHFRDKLGQGGFGSVYKGQNFNGSLVAVKVLENSKFSGEEFINEVSTIGRIHHVNVVRLLGFCSEGSKRALVYEYMTNGSLDRHIFLKKGNSQTFSWEKLHGIALGTARGIEYLHNGCDVCILHFDIKPHNILLDRNFIPKVADFGLAKFCPKENDFICVSTTRGTIGYIAPELISRNFGTVSCKSDVYSFGMLLLEMAGGRRNSFAKATRSSKAYFPSWVHEQIIEGRDMELQNVSEIEAVIARKMCIIGLWCIQVKATDRPSITKVVEMLEGSIDDLPIPPKPFFSSSPPPQCSSIAEIQSDSSTESIEECSN